MSTSSKTETTTGSASSNAGSKTTVEKQVVDVKEETIKIKDLKFQELIDWLKKWGYEIKDTSKENKIEGIELQAQITPQLPYTTGVTTPLYLEFQKDLDDGFILRTTFEFALREKVQANEADFDIGFSQLENLIYPMNVSMIKSYPLINIYKVIFYENLTKQIFLDSINGLIHSMSLIIGKMNVNSMELTQKP